MPVAHTGTCQYTLIHFAVDMLALAGTAKFRTTVNGIYVGDIEIGVGPDALGPMLAAQPESGKSRAFDITDAIYAHAISVGALPGEIQ